MSRDAESIEAKMTAKRREVILTVSFYIVAALVMVLVNKWVLNSVDIPLTFLWTQLVIAVLLLHLTDLLGWFKLPVIDLQVCKGLVPLISVNVIGLIFNTYCLQYVDASFYQVARGLVLPLTVLFEYIFRQKTSTRIVLVTCAIVCSGFFVGISGERLTVTGPGIFFGVFSSMTTAIHAIVIKKAHEVVKGGTIELVYYNNLLSAAVVLPLIMLSNEPRSVVKILTAQPLSIAHESHESSSAMSKLHTFLIGAAITGLWGFLINVAGFRQIKITSPVSHMIASAVRGVLATFLAIAWFGDVITAGRGGGITLILIGSVLYTWVKDREAKKMVQIERDQREDEKVNVNVQK